KASKSSQESISAIQPELESCWNQLEQIRETEYPVYVFRGLLRKNIYSIAVLNELEKIIFSFRADQNILHISEFNKIISRVVFAEPVPFIYERLGEKYANYLIDEFQDTSIVQWQNLLPLVENSLAGNNFNMLVGDGKQAIYRWRGGEVEQFARLPYLSSHTDNPLIRERELSLVRNHTEKHLAKNWRSKKEIVEFNNTFFRSLSAQLSDESKLIYDRLEQEYKPDNAGGYVRIEALEPDADDKMQIFIDRTIATINELRKEDWAYSEIAILCRRKIEGSEIATALLKSGVPVLSSESLLLKYSPLVSFMVSLLRCIDHPADELASAQVLEYLVSTKKINKHLHECLKEFSESSNDLSAVLKKHNIIFDGLRFARLPIYQRCEELISCFGLGDETDSYLLFFLDEILNYTNSRSKDKIDFFEWWEDRSREASIVVPEGMDAVTVMTIHKSKGLEFPVVIFPFANWEIAARKTEKWVQFNDPEIPQLKTALISLTKELLNTP
ncbi:MAG TPA: 3'-5' exonuclease, partial [Bacteroidia bacterium]|nr:3'-5' exonuclease [Bacteroidia bacterium]